MAKKEPDEYGGYNHEFVDEVADRYNCQICTKVIREPHLAVCCGQHFCESCLSKWFTRQGKESCPHCRAEGEGFHHVINKGLRSEINQLKIKCSNHGKGCKWTGELGELKTHLKSEKGCGFVVIQCPNKCMCNVYTTLMRKDLKNHLNTECVLRPYQCEYCGFKDTYESITGISDSGLLSDICVTHYDVCSSYPLACPNPGCRVDCIKRIDMKNHRSKCPHEQVECPFAEAGCKTYQLLRCQLDDHLSSNQQQHLLLVMGAYKQMKDQLHETEAKLTTAVQLLRQGKEADKETVDSIVTCCLTYLKKKGDKVTVTMPRVSEYHRSGKIWYCAPFYFKEGYKMCLAVSIKKMESGVCTGVSMSICLLKGEYDKELKWPIGDNQCDPLLPPRPPLPSSDFRMPFVICERFHICPMQQLQQTNGQLLHPYKSYFDLVNDCLTFTVRYLRASCSGCLQVEVKCRRM